MNEALSAMWRDIGEARFLVVVFLLPSLISIPSIRRGSRVAWLAPLILVLQVAAWFWYYASSHPNVGIGPAVATAALGWVIGMGTSMVALLLAWKQRRPRHQHLDLTAS